MVGWVSPLGDKGASVGTEMSGKRTKEIEERKAKVREREYEY